MTLNNVAFLCESQCMTLSNVAFYVNLNA